MGKINDKMRKSRENITNDVEPISQEVIHEHEWMFREEYTNEVYSPTTLRTRLDRYARYACHCGAVKRVKQFEVKT